MSSTSTISSRSMAHHYSSTPPNQTTHSKTQTTTVLLFTAGDNVNGEEIATTFHLASILEAKKRVKGFFHLHANSDKASQSALTLFQMTFSLSSSLAKIKCDESINNINELTKFAETHACQTLICITGTEPLKNVYRVLREDKSIEVTPFTMLTLERKDNGIVFKAVEKLELGEDGYVLKAVEELERKE